MFLTGLKQFGKKWKLISGLIETRSVVQIRSHAQKYFKRKAEGRDINCAGQVGEDGQWEWADDMEVVEGEEGEEGGVSVGVVSSEGSNTSSANSSPPRAQVEQSGLVEGDEVDFLGDTLLEFD